MLPLTKPGNCEGGSSPEDSHTPRERGDPPQRRLLRGRIPSFSPWCLRRRWNLGAWPEKSAAAGSREPWRIPGSPGARLRWRWPVFTCRARHGPARLWKDRVQIFPKSQTTIGKREMWHREGGRNLPSNDSPFIVARAPQWGALLTSVLGLCIGLTPVRYTAPAATAAGMIDCEAPPPRVRRP
eukprot:gene13053-biopygen9531